MSTAPVAELEPATFNYIRELVLKRAAIVLDDQKIYLVETRLAPIVREHGLTSIDQLVDQLRGCKWSVLHQMVVEALTTNETSFFRDLHPFESLRALVIPELLQKRVGTKSLNIWSAACSTGQEPYTIAIILREHFPTLQNWTVKIYGSDISQQVLKRARSGVYHQTEVNRGLPAALLVKYFQKRGMQWEVKDEIRRKVEFLEVNLVEQWPALPQMDIVFLRNVLIYFSCDTKRKILADMRRALKPDGYLFLGGAETTINLDPNLHRVQKDSFVFYQLRPEARK